MGEKKSYARWGIMSFLGYIIFNLSGVLLNYICSKTIDPDLYEITAHILTSTQGLFSAIMGYGDFIQYSGFHPFPFLLGGSDYNWCFSTLYLKKNRYY